MRVWLTSSTTLKPAALAGRDTVAAGRNVALFGASAVLACALGLPSVARAAFIPPAGVAEYRLIFVSAHGITGTSSKIADYNSFATTEAASNPSLPSTIWTAVASTDSVSAVSNIACTPDCSGIPIFLVNGTQVTTSSTALFSASTATPLQHAINETQSGNNQSGYAWSGSFSNGTQNIQTIGNTTFDTTLGNGSGPVEYGWSGLTDRNAIDSGGTYSISSSQPIYAISGVISAVPEPATASLLGFAGVVTGLMGAFRRRRKAVVTR